MHCIFPPWSGIFRIFLGTFLKKIYYRKKKPRPCSYFWLTEFSPGLLITGGTTSPTLASLFLPDSGRTCQLPQLVGLRTVTRREGLLEARIIVITRTTVSRTCSCAAATITTPGTTALPWTWRLGSGAPWVALSATGLITPAGWHLTGCCSLVEITTVRTRQKCSVWRRAPPPTTTSSSTLAEEPVSSLTPPRGPSSSPPAPTSPDTTVRAGLSPCPG